MATVQETIDNLISYIDAAVAKHSVSNRHVATVLAFLNEGLKAVSTEVLDEKYLNRDKVDSTDFLLKLLGGVEIGDFVDSITAGSGASIDPKGNAQLQSLEVRGAAQFREVIINRLSAIEGDFEFTESGTIDKVIHVQDNVYILAIRKRWNYDFTAFKADDVVHGSLNSLLADGSILTSWFRVISVDVSANTLTVALYDDVDVPDVRNYPPVAGMNIKRRGNAVDEERQSCWYISVYEGVIMYLEGVTKPILEESNYYLSIGRPKHLELFNGLPINYKHPYLFARGAIIRDLLRVDWTGNPEYELVDVGPWLPTGEYIRDYSEELKKYVQHQVWYGSCCWRCVVEAATVGVAPRWNNTQWVCVVGDSNFSLAITSSKGRFFYFGREYTTLGFILKHGDTDITVDAWQVEWSRESGLPEEDTLWNIEHSSCGSTVEITPEDMPSNWYDTRKVMFRCTVYLKDGEVEQTMTETISIN
jgi:hypothetical protein